MASAPILAVETLRLGTFPNLVWVILTDADGTTGLGETFMGAAAVEAYLHEEAAPRLFALAEAGVEPARLALRPYVGHQAPGAEVRGNAAVDIALWDLAGRRAGVPVHQLLGGRVRERIRVYNTCAGYRYVRAATGQTTGNWGRGAADGPYEDLEAFLTDAGRLAESLLDEGIEAMKIWPFDAYAEGSAGQHITPAELAEGLAPFRLIRERVGGRMDVMLEMHSLWSMPAAVAIARAAAAHGLFWVEDPCRMANPSMLADLRRQLPVRLTASETVADRRGFAALLAANAVDVVMFDLAWCGGLTEGRAIAALAEAWDRPIAPHDCTGPVTWAASCHLSVSAPNALLQESVRAFYTGWYTELVDRLPVVDKGWVAPPEGPGLGLSLKPALFGRPDAVHRKTVA